MKKILVVINVLIGLFIILQVVLYLSVYQGIYNPIKVKEEFANPNGRHLMAFFINLVFMNFYIIPILFLLFIKFLVKARLLKRTYIFETEIEALGRE